MKNNKGMSLIELLVSVSILSLVLIAVGFILNSLSKSFATSQREVALQDNMQTTFAVLSDLVKESQTIDETASCIETETSLGLTYIYAETYDYQPVLEASATPAVNEAHVWVVYFDRADRKLYLCDEEYDANDPSTLEAIKEKKYKKNEDGTVYVNAAGEKEESAQAVKLNYGKSEYLLAIYVENFSISGNVSDGYIVLNLELKNGTRTASIIQNVYLRNSASAILDTSNPSPVTPTGGAGSSSVTIKTKHLPNSFVNSDYNVTIQASQPTGVVTYEWEKSSDTVLPAGLNLTLTNSSDITITGKPTTTGTYKIKLKVKGLDEHGVIVGKQFPENGYYELVLTVSKKEYTSEKFDTSEPSLSNTGNPTLEDYYNQVMDVNYKRNNDVRVYFNTGTEEKVVYGGLVTEEVYDIKKLCKGCNLEYGTTWDGKPQCQQYWISSLGRGCVYAGQTLTEDKIEEVKTLVGTREVKEVLSSESVRNDVIKIANDGQSKIENTKSFGQGYNSNTSFEDYYVVVYFEDGQTKFDSVSLNTEQTTGKGSCTYSIFGDGKYLEIKMPQFRGYDQGISEFDQYVFNITISSNSTDSPTLCTYYSSAKAAQ